MSKRFRDRDIWQKPWYRKLAPKDRGAWDYLADWCDNVGVWVPDFEAAEFYINGKPDWANLPSKCNGNIIVLESGKWWLIDFCKFQYGELQESNRAHASYIRLLRQHGLYDLYLDTLKDENKGHTRPLQGSKEQEQDKDKEKDKDKDKEKDKDKDKDKDIATSQNDLLYQAIWQSFLAKTEKFTNYPKEAQATKRIIEYAKRYSNDDPVSFTGTVITKFYELTQGGSQFWRVQPFTPSALSSSGIFDRVLAELKSGGDPNWTDHLEDYADAAKGVEF